jgi:hypothetical protein
LADNGRSETTLAALAAFTDFLRVVHKTVLADRMGSLKLRARTRLVPVQHACARLETVGNDRVGNRATDVNGWSMVTTTGSPEFDVATGPQFSTFASAAVVTDVAPDVKLI